MELVSRKIGGEQVEVPVYTLEEAEELGLDTVPWKEARVGQWGITDDGYAMECRSCKDYVSATGWKDTYRVFTAGVCWGSCKKPFNFERIHANRAYSAVSGDKWQDVDFRRIVVKELIHQAALQRITRGVYDYKQLAGVYRHDGDPYYGMGKVKWLLRSRKGKELVRTEIEKIMIGGGMSVADWIELGKRSFEKAAEKDDVVEMRRIWEKWGEFLAIKEAHTRELSPIAGQTVLDAVSEDLKQIPASGAKNGK